MQFRKVISIIFYYLLVIVIFLGVTIGSSKATSVIAQKIPMPRQHTVVIDPGHGGEDGGATSCSGVLESQINLEISLRVNDLFKLLGYDTRMIRTKDVSVYTEGTTIAQKKVSDLKNRVAIINKTENAVLISIHQNTFSASQYSGGQVFYSPNEQSHQLADALQNALCRSINRGSSRKCKPSDGVYLMQHINCTGVLVECGFLSNPEEEAKLRSPEYQKKLACVISSTVGIFLDQQSDH